MEAQVLETKLTELKSALMPKMEQFDTEIKKFGVAQQTTADELKSLHTQIDAIDKQLHDRLNPVVDPAEGKDMLQEAMEQEESIGRLLKNRRGNAVIQLNAKSAREIFERKTTITVSAVGSATTGVLPIGRLPGITTEPQQGLTIRDLLTSNPTTFQSIDYVKVSTPMTIASPVPETSTKPENQLNFTSLSERVKLIATLIPASRQILDDMPELMSFIRRVMPYYVNLAEELQILSGDNTGEDLHGLIPQATAFNTGLFKPAAGWNKIDIVGRAIQQITMAKELPPTFIVMNPIDWWDIRLTKDGFGRYILGDPQDGAMMNATFGSIVPRQNIFGLAVDATTSIAAGTFLVGSGSPIASEIRDRMEMQIDISTEHSTFFAQNLVMVRAEKRLALIVRRPGSYVSGTFTTSP